MERLERVKLAQEMEPAPDALSISLRKFGAELAALDDEGIAELLEAWNRPSENGQGLDLTPDDIREMARSYAR